MGRVYTNWCLKKCLNRHLQNHKLKPRWTAMSPKPTATLPKPISMSEISGVQVTIYVTYWMDEKISHVALPTHVVPTWC